MNVREIIAELDRREGIESDEQLCAWLDEKCREYEAAGAADAAGIAALYNELGGICRRNRWLERGEKAFLQAKSVLEGAGIKDGNYASTLNNLAGLYRIGGRHELSAEMFRRCREIYESMPTLPVDVLASVYNNLGLLYLDMKNPGLALEEFEQAERMIAAIPDNHYVHAVTAGNSAFAHYRLGDILKAAEYMLKAANIAEKLPDGGEMRNNYLSLYRQLGGKEE